MSIVDKLIAIEDINKLYNQVHENEGDDFIDIVEEGRVPSLVKAYCMGRVTIDFENEEIHIVSKKEINKSNTEKIKLEFLVKDQTIAMTQKVKVSQSGGIIELDLKSIALMYIEDKANKQDYIINQISGGDLAVVNQASGLFSYIPEEKKR